MPINKEMAEFVEALRNLKSAVVDMRREALDSQHIVRSVITDGHLTSTLRLLKEDLGFRRTLELTY